MWLQVYYAALDLDEHKWLYNHSMFYRCAAPGCGVVRDAGWRLMRSMAIVPLPF